MISAVHLRSSIATREDQAVRGGGVPRCGPAAARSLQIFREVTSVGRENKLYRNEMMLGGRHADVKSVSCLLLNVVAGTR